MSNRVLRASLGLAFATLLMTLPSAAFGGCGQACYDIECEPDHFSIGCVENFGFCWEVPCFATADSEGCDAHDALETAFASFEDMNGEEALEKLRNDKTFAQQVLPYLRVVGQEGEVFRGTKYQRPAPMVADSENSAGSTEDDTQKSADR